MSPDASGSNPGASGSSPDVSGSCPEAAGVSRARSVSELLKIKRNLALFDLQYLDLKQDEDFQKKNYSYSEID